MIVSIGSEVYLALAKGGLVEGHCLIIPFGHCHSSRFMMESNEQDMLNALSEVETYKKTLQDAFSAQDKTVIFYEIHGGPQDDNSMQHVHIQAIPLDNEKVVDIQSFFVKEAEKEGLELVQDLPSDPDSFVKIDYFKEGILWYRKIF